MRLQAERREAGPCRRNPCYAAITCSGGAHLALALAIAADLGARAADLHLAPAPAVVFGQVEKDPPAVLAWALLYPLMSRPGQQIGDRARNRPKRTIEGRLGFGPVPDKAMRHAVQRRLAHG